MISKKEIGIQIKKYRERLGLTQQELGKLIGVTHTSATIMVSESLGKGVGLADIMKVLGHSRMETTLRYLHDDENRMKKAVEIIEAKYLGG